MVKIWLKRIGLVILLLAMIVFFGRWLLDLFGVIKYEPPMSQDRDQIVCVELLDSSGVEFIVIKTIENEELAVFLEDFFLIEAGRYANDPATRYGDYAIKIYYVDGGYDILGEIVDFYSSDGERLPVGGWYYIPKDEMQVIIDKYV